MKWNAEETGTRLLFVCKRNIPIQVARMKARATQAPRIWKKMSITFSFDLSDPREMFLKVI